MLPSCTVHMQQVYGDASLNASENAFHIAFGIDENYARSMGVLMVSLQAANPELPLIFHVITESIKAEDLSKISALSETLHCLVNIYFISIEKSDLAKLPITGHYSTAMYYRLLMPDILHSVTPRILYLDSDIICLGSLKELGSLDLKGKTIAAASDIPKIVAEKVSELGLHNNFYFNSGMMLIDIARWNQSDISTKVLAVLAEHYASFSLADQDALNLVLAGDVLSLSPIWNQIYDLGQMSHDPVDGTVFLHYAGTVKPWRLSGRHRLSSWYRGFENVSPWAGLPLLPPKDYKEMEIYARLSLKAGDLPTALRLYWKYLIAKFHAR